MKTNICSAISAGSQIAEVISSLLAACSADTAEPQRRAIFETCIDVINQEKLTSLVTKNVIGKLLFEVHILAREEP